MSSFFHALTQKKNRGRGCSVISRSSVQHFQADFSGSRRGLTERPFTETGVMDQFTPPGFARSFTLFDAAADSDEFLMRCL